MPDHEIEVNGTDRDSKMMNDEKRTTKHKSSLSRTEARFTSTKAADTKLASPSETKDNARESQLHNYGHATFTNQISADSDWNKL